MNEDPETALVAELRALAADAGGRANFVVLRGGHAVDRPLRSLSSSEASR